MACDTPHAPQIVFAIGVLPAPAVSRLTVVSSPAFTRIVAAISSPASFPDGPPPKSLERSSFQARSVLRETSGVCRLTGDLW